MGERDNWWHIIAFTPFAIIIGGLLGGQMQMLISGLFVLLYPIAVTNDLNYLKSNRDGWNPNKWLHIIFSLIVFLTLGMFSFIYTPYYLYRRKFSTY